MQQSPLRNQIMHGGATFNSTVNRSQLKDACNILSTLIPEMLKVMLQNPDDKSLLKSKQVFITKPS